MEQLQCPILVINTSVLMLYSQICFAYPNLFLTKNQGEAET